MKNYEDFLDDIVYEDGFDSFEEYRDYMDFLENYKDVERPAEQDGLVLGFLRGFPTEEMRGSFRTIAAEFFEKETWLRDTDKSSLFKDMFYPAREEKHIEDPYIFTVLQMMLICAQNGSAYSRNLLITLYKTYFKKEYNVLKRFQKLRPGDLQDFMIIARKSRYEEMGLQYKPGDEDIQDLEEENVAERIILMCDLLGIEVDPAFNGLIAGLNRDAVNKVSIWKLINLTFKLSPDIQEDRIESFQEGAAYLTDRMPNEDWLLCENPDPDDDASEDMISIAANAINHALDECDVNSDIFLEDLSFDLYDSTASMLGRTKIDKEQTTDNEIKLLGVIYYLAEVIGKLEKSRENELRDALGISFRRIDSKEWLLERGFPEEKLREYLNSDTKLTETDKRIEKLLGKINPLKAATGRSGSISGQKDANSAASVPADRETERSESDMLREELQTKSRRLAELEGMLQEQRTMLGESRKREISLQSRMEDWKREHAELTAMRNFVHALKSENMPNDEPATDHMIEYLSGRKLLIVGGNENWVKKMRKIFPGWNFVGSDAGLGIDGAVGSCEKIYFYTDIVSHAMYYQFIKRAAVYKKPYSFLHGTNIDMVIENIYRDLRR